MFMILQLLVLASSVNYARTCDTRAIYLCWDQQGTILADLMRAWEQDTAYVCEMANEYAECVQKGMETGVCTPKQDSTLEYTKVFADAVSDRYLCKFRQPYDFVPKRKPAVVGDEKGDKIVGDSGHKDRIRNKNKETDSKSIKYVKGRGGRSDSPLPILLITAIAGVFALSGI